ncbi:hypothetical protein R69658_04320 [Paraburkholderia aspalathi]|uniref:Uncharacterized protein n=1 Tax=Paraburkholderia aspalathi TaxID=1324617 RepID=A0ABN7M6I7_9BURK|nr:hypothetical protein R69658_04320 [Paraburkholderia aspalathi]
MEMVQGYAYLLADHLAQWVQPMTAMPAKPQLVAIRGDAGTGEFAGTLVRIGAPGWDRTSNPCLRSFTCAPRSLLNQCLAQLANCKIKANQRQSGPIQSPQGAI